MAMVELESIADLKSNSRTKHSSCDAYATDDELIVAQIMLNLPYYVDIVESLPPPKWGRKRRRSAPSDFDPSPSAPPNINPKSTASLVNPLSSATSESDKKCGRRTSNETSRKRKDDCIKPKCKETAASPVTPLSFSPSESEEKCGDDTTLKRISRKRSTVDYADTIMGLTEQKIVLRKEVENVRNYYKKLKSMNSHLKAKKEEVLHCRSRMEVVPQVVNRTNEVLEPVVAQFRVPDLNIGAADDGAHRRTMSAEARRRRMRIIKVKFLKNGGCGSKFSA